jgi:beta-glucosidase
VDGDASPLFVFGHGLSYTTFDYGPLTVTPPAGCESEILVAFNVTNTGQREGDEVAQVYVRRTTASIATPVKELKGFARVHLKPRETKPVTIHLPLKDLEVWAADRQWKAEPGELTVMVGGSSATERSATVTLR